MRIELDLTDNESDWLQAQAAQEAIHTGDSSFLDRVTRAIERAESFVDDDDSGDEMAVCAGCNGAREVLSHFASDGMAYYMQCYRCSGTGKEWV